MAANSIVENIYQQFIDYFGEDRVDIQNLSNIQSDSFSRHRDVNSKVILVHWKEVTITNEFDESVEIWDLYGGTVINSAGMLEYRPVFNRSTYDNIQWISDYGHSHLPGINKDNIRNFRKMCLGKGPINVTIHRLQNDSFTDMDMWKLYCWELDKLVRVESIKGGPYRRVANIGANRNSNGSIINDFPIKFAYERPNKEVITEIIKVLIKNKILSYTYYDGHYVLATPFIDTVLLISNAFIDWYNSCDALREKYSREYLYSNNIIREMYIVDNALYGKNSANIPIDVVIGSEMFTFKGKPVKLALINSNENNSIGGVHVININILGYVVYTLLKFVNLKYGKSKNNATERARVI